MKIIKPYAKLMAPLNEDIAGNVKLESFNLDDGIRLLQHVEWCARISHRSEEKVTEDSWKKIIQHVVLEHGDWSVVEHATVSVDMVVDRGITHEWVRHRLFGFTQESTRFVNYEKKMPPSFVYPDPDIECRCCLAGGEATWRAEHGCYMHYTPDLMWEDCAYHVQWVHGIAAAEYAYKKLLAEKWPPQKARSVFPNALASRIITTGNLRNWRHVLMMRTTQEAHPQMKQVMIPLLKEFQVKIPMLFDDIVPNRKQSEAMKIAR